MPKGKMKMDGGSVMGGMYGDGSRASKGMPNMNGRIDPGMTPMMSQTKSKMTGMPMGGQTKGSAKASMMMSGNGARRKGGGY